MIHTTAQLHVVCCNNIKEHPSQNSVVFWQRYLVYVQREQNLPQWTTSAVSGPANNSSNNDANLTKSQKKHHKWKTNTQAIAEIQNKLDAAIAQNQQYQEILKPDALKKVITQAVALSSPPKTQASTNPFSKPYLGKPRPPQMMPGVDGTLDPSLECRYCKDKGHWANNCKKVKLKEEQARTGQTPRATNETPN